VNKTRRRLVGATGAAIAAGTAAWFFARPRSESDTAAAPVKLVLGPDPAFPNALRVPGDDAMFGMADVGGALTLVSTPVRHEILPGKPAALLAYSLEYQGRKFLNPLLRVQKGASLRVRYWNALDETSIVHWHGLSNDTNNDGHPHYAVGPGETYDYQFTVANRAGTYWYHPHPHHLAGKQAYLGLAGLLVVDDDEDNALTKALDLKLGVTDIPLLIQDKRFDGDGALRYTPGAHEHFQGYCGDSVLVNLTPSPCLDCATRMYRFRLVNGSNARIYRLAFMQREEPLPLRVIGADGGLLEHAVSAREIFLAPSERADVLLDLSAAALGDRVVLSSLPFDAMNFSAKPQPKAKAADPVPPNGAPLELMLLRVVEEMRYEKPVPQALSRIDAITHELPEPRVFTLDHAKGMWRINRATYRMTDTAFTVKRGTTEVWEFRNPGPAMPHPVHVHGFQYRVLERRESPAAVSRLATDARGLPPTELGWKDSVLLWPGETLRMLIDFTHPFPGDQVYMLQCHNLEHETHGMMVNFKVAA
jgi:blue copper oxidase